MLLSLLSEQNGMRQLWMNYLPVAKKYLQADKVDFRDIGVPGAFEIPLQ